MIAWAGGAAFARVELPIVADSAEAVDQQPVVHHATGQLEIAWEATTDSSNVVFRLYRRGGLEDYKLVSELPAIPGQADYRVGHSASNGSQTYQLRVAARGTATTDHREVVLGSFEVQVPDWQDSESTATSESSFSADLRGLLGLPEASLAALAATEPARFEFVESSPPDPPPRLG